MDTKAVVPVQLGLHSSFQFRCHKGIQCFTQCCHNIDILLTPYDILRLKKRLGMTSGEFLSRYTYVLLDEKSSHPHVYLKMSDCKEKKCPFVSSQGCSIYSDRPANCRYYPIGQGTLKKQGKDGHIDEEFYFFVREPHCLGYHEKKEWTVESWRSDQEVDLFDDMNREWKTIQVRIKMPGMKGLDERQQSMFYMASYDIDRFRSFIFESRFLDIFDIDRRAVEEMKNDETKLMKFGFDYIKYFMMIEQPFTVKEHVIDKKPLSTGKKTSR